MKRPSAILMLALLSCAATSNALSPVQWARQSGTVGTDLGLSVATDRDTKDVYLSGYKNATNLGNSTGSYSFISKYNSSGTLLWTSTNTSTSYNQATAVAVDAEGNAYLTGITSGDMDSQPAVGGEDIFLVKYSSAGEKLWTRVFGTALTDYPSFLAADKDSNICIAGFTTGNFYGTNAGAEDVLLVKYDSSGNSVWQRQAGTSASDQALGVACDPAGNIFVSGNTTGSFGGFTNAGGWDIFLLKYTSSGTLTWARQVGSDNTDFGCSVAADPEGSAYIGGYTKGNLDGNFNTANGIEDICLVKYNSSGARLWTRTIGTANVDVCSAIAADASNNLYLTGWTQGALDGNTPQGYEDVFVVRYSSVGVKQYTYTFGTSSIDWGLGICTDSSEPVPAVYVTGATQGAVDISTTNAGGMDPFLVKLAVSPPQIAKAEIKNPGPWTKISGNYVNVMAEIVYGSPSDVQKVQFEYRQSTTSPWIPMVAANPNHPNPDTDSPYFIQWNIDDFTEGYYDLRAVAYDLSGTPDPQPAFITVIIDHHHPDYEEKKTVNLLETSISIDTTHDNTVLSGDGAFFTTVYIPSGAIASTGTTVVVQTISPSGGASGLRASAATIPDITTEKISPAGEYRDISFTTGETVLLRDIYVSIPYNDSDNNSLTDNRKIPLDRLEPYWYNTSALKWEKVPGSALDRAGSSVAFSVGHLSLFGIFSEAASSLSRIKAYPNPYKPGSGNTAIIFDNISYGSGIKIYELSGEPVFSRSGINGGAFNWNPVADSDGKPLASGIYVYQVTDASGNKTSGKIAIIR